MTVNSPSYSRSTMEHQTSPPDWTSDDQLHATVRNRDLPAGPYLRGGLLGSGGWSCVYKVCRLRDGALFAGKVSKATKQLRAEAAILRSLNHVRCSGCPCAELDTDGARNTSSSTSTGTKTRRRRRPRCLSRSCVSKERCRPRLTTYPTERTERKRCWSLCSARRRSNTYTARASSTRTSSRATCSSGAGTPSTWPSPTAPT